MTQLEAAIVAAHADAYVSAEASFSEEGIDSVALEVRAIYEGRRFMKREIVASMVTLRDEYLVAINWTNAFWSRIGELIQEASPVAVTSAQLADLSAAHRSVLNVLTSARGFFKTDGHSIESIAAAIAKKRYAANPANGAYYVDPAKLQQIIHTILLSLRARGLAKQNPLDEKKWMLA